MGWTKREVVSDLVILGDSEGQVQKVGGLLAGIVPDPRYPDNKRYELVQKDETSKWVAGSAAINSQLGVADIGKFVKLTFKGWAHGRSSRFKDIEVLVYEGEPTPEMKQWPRWEELRKRREEPPPPDDVEVEALEEDDDLPF